MKKNWVLPQTIPADIDQALSGYPPLLRKLLWMRGVYSQLDARTYLEGSWSYDSELKNLEDACELILSKKGKGPIFIHGDYDVDGITSAAILYEALREAGLEARTYFPNRFKDGYGMTSGIIKFFSMLKCPLVIAVDCGIRSLEEAQLARKLGIDMVIIDHHDPGPDLPDAIIVNPKMADDPYSEKNLASAGLAYHVARKLLGPDAEKFLELAALGTVADVAPLTGENRFIVRKGLGQINQTERIGLQALIEVGGIKDREITAMDIGFVLGPRLNAAGRLDDCRSAFDLLTVSDNVTVWGLARKLNILNGERQRLTTKSMKIVEEQFKYFIEPPLVLFNNHPDFNQGIVGLMAARVCQKYYRPSIIGKYEDGEIRASCRSIPGFHITNALDECSDLLIQYGGHELAAGLALDPTNIGPFMDRMIAIAKRELTPEMLQPTINIDAELELSEVSFDLIDELSWLEPTGQANQRPIFVSYGVDVHSSKTMGKNKDHLRLIVSQNNSPPIDAVGFYMGEFGNTLADSQINLVYHLDINHYQGNVSLQIQILDIRRS